MIDISNVDIHGWTSAIRGMRNPMNSWDKSDTVTYWDGDDYDVSIGENDLNLMRKLFKAGTDHSKYLRFVTVTLDINAPLYWWKEYDTYKIGTVANSCSTMHKIHSKEFTLDDFSCEHLNSLCKEHLLLTIQLLNNYRLSYIINPTKDSWWQMIQLLPSSYNQKRTVQLNYQVLSNIYDSRHTHKLDEWKEFCKWIETLPYFKEIMGLEGDVD